MAGRWGQPGLKVAHPNVTLMPLIWINRPGFWGLIFFYY